MQAYSRNSQELSNPVLTLFIKPLLKIKLKTNNASTLFHVNWGRHINKPRATVVPAVK